MLQWFDFLQFFLMRLEKNRIEEGPLMAAICKKYPNTICYSNLFCLPHVTYTRKRDVQIDSVKTSLDTDL